MRVSRCLLRRAASAQEFTDMLVAIELRELVKEDERRQLPRDPILRGLDGRRVPLKLPR